MPTTDPRTGAGARRVDPGTGSRRLPATTTFILSLLAVSMVGLVGFVLVTSGVGPLPDPERCRAVAGGRAVQLDPEQAENAAVIAGTAVRRDLPTRAATIALAAAYQESGLRNLPYGDRDSLGLFQQRPSQGWGSAEQVQDPRHATQRFYDALLALDGYNDLGITEAAQRVQRSAFGRAYADHEADARVLASVLTGDTRAGFTCSVRRPEVAAEREGPGGLTGRARAVLQDLRQTFGPLPVGGFAPGGVRSGHMAGSAHYDGRAVDVFFRPVDASSRRRGWAVAHYLVARADRLDIQTVIFDDRIWQAGSDAGWRDYRPPSRPGDRAVLEHRDHVHVDVF